jgi:hypothetical protein
MLSLSELMADGNFPALLTNCVVCFLSEQIFDLLFISIRPQDSLRQRLFSLHLLLDQHYTIMACGISESVSSHAISILNSCLTPSY